MPGLVKVGYTDRSPTERARELSSSTGVPEEFVVHAWWKILNDDASEMEKKIHSSFKKNRHRNNREFFSITPERAIAEIEALLEAMNWSANSADYHYECTIERLKEHREKIKQERLVTQLESERQENYRKQLAVRRWNEHDANKLLDDLMHELSSKKSSGAIKNSAKFVAFSALTAGLGLLAAPAYLKQKKKEQAPHQWEAFKKYRLLRLEYFTSKGFASVPDDAVDHTKDDKNPFL